MKFNRNNSPLLWQDAGMLFFFISILTGSLIVALSIETLLIQNVIMLIGLFFCCLLVGFHVYYAAAIMTSFIILTFTCYKSYMYYAYGYSIELTAFIWPAVLLIGLGGMCLFIKEHANVEMVNQLLNDQVENLTVIDPLTRLENLKSMYSNLARTMSLSKRNKSDIVLLIVRLRYATELKKILSRRGFNALRQRIAKIAQDTLRLEDRVYAIDDEGSLGAICFCKNGNGDLLKARLLAQLEDQNNYEDIFDKPIRVEMRVGFLPYKEEMGVDPIFFYQEVENEIQYDV